jgi:two-component system CheB/CheR fusion protein
VPILRSDRVVAVVGVGNKPIDYTADDAETVKHLADVAWTIVERKRAEEALRRSEQHNREAAEALREADRQKDHFLAMLSHELRNPLAPIKNSLAILERVAPGGEQAKQAHQIIDRQVGHLTRLVDDLLDVTRISRGKVRLRREPLDLRELLIRSVEDHRFAFVANGVELATALTEEAVVVEGDWTRLVQTVGNLLDNAVKFTPRGGHTLVSLGRDARSGEAVIRVRDTGAGIAAEMVPRLFEDFTQDDGTLARSRGGLGIGLALVKGLVEMHGGRVSARSDGRGKGAEFEVRLPGWHGVPGTLGQDIRKPIAAPAPRRVLIIEDNPDAAESLRLVLEARGHQVEVAHDGPAGTRKARELRPEVVLCDIGLPGMDGYQVARAFRRDEALRSACLVALTGHSLAEDIAHAREAGFDHHLAKPAALEVLDAILAGCLGPA